ncbi:MAG: methyltransferase family protein [Promethearchaeota archaeon]
MIIEIIKTSLKKVLVGIGLIFLYLPIIAGILAPMVVFNTINVYFSWRIIGGYDFTDWTWAYYVIHPILIPIMISIEILLFCLGLGLFLIGLITMVKKNIEKVHLIQTGIYKYIRHPQNLGIIIMVFSFTLYVPGFKDLGIRMGDIASWMLFVLFLCLYSYYEEWRLSKKYNNEYLEYYKITGFFIPKFRRDKNLSLLKINFQKKILIATIQFLVFIVLFSIFVQLAMDVLMLYRYKS